MTSSQKIFSPDGKPMLSAKKVAVRLGCAPDYVGKLCREGKLEGRRVENAWFVDERSIVSFEASRAASKAQRAEELSQLRRKENKEFQRLNTTPAERFFAKVSKRGSRHFVAIGLGTFFLFSAVVFAATISNTSIAEKLRGNSNSLVASLAQIESPFFGNHPVAIVSNVPPKNTSNIFSSLLAFFFGSKSSSVATTAQTPSPIVSVAQPAPAVHMAPAVVSVANTTPSAPTVVQHNTYPVIEKTIERTVTVSGVSEDTLNTKLNQLENALRSQIALVSNPGYGSPQSNFNVPSRIDTLSNITVYGVKGLTDADIPNNITVDGYLPLSGGTLSGALNGSSTATSTFTGGFNLLSGCFSVNGVCVSGGGSAAGATGYLQYNTGGAFDATSTLFFDSANGRLGIGTSTPKSTLSLGAGGVIRVTANDGSTDGCFREIAGQLQYSNDCTTFQGFSAAAAGGWTDTGTVVHLTTGSENVGVGTSSPYAKLTIWGASAVSGLAFEIANSASTTVFAVSNAGVTTVQNLVATGAATFTNFTANNSTTTNATSTTLFTSTLAVGSLTGLLKATGGVVSTAAAGVDYENPLTFSAPLSRALNVVSVSQANVSTSGYLSSADFQLFTNKISSSSLSATYPLAYNSATGVFSSAFSTTTTNTWSQLQQFASGASTTELSVYNGAYFGSTATSTFTSTGFLGLGTTSPSQILSVQGNALLSGNLSLANITATGTLSIAGAITSTATGANTLPFASSTALTVSGTGYFGTASTTNLTVSSLGPSAGQCLTVNSSGSVTVTTCGSGGTFPFTQTTFGSTNANATSTLIGFNAGLYALASSTIGNGTQAGGLTISGGATTTGLLAVLGSGTSTIASNVSMSGNIIPSVTNTYSLGSSLFHWKDLFLGPGSLYVNGQEVIHTDGSNNVVVSSSINQNLVVQTTGSANIELNPSGTGQVLLKNTINVTAGKSITTSDLSALLIPNGVAAGNVTISGNTIQATNLNGGIAITPAGSGGTYFTSGNVGVGSTTPATTLSVSGNTYTTGGLGVGVLNTVAGTLQTSGNATVGGTLTLSPISRSALLASDANGTVIATTTPSAAAFLATSTTATSTFAGGLSAASSLFVLQNGTIGVGTAAPTKTFDVSGTGRFSSTLTLSGVSSCTGSQALQTNGAGDVTCGTLSVGGSSSAGGWTTNNIGSITLSTTTDRVAVGASTTPYAKLSILSGAAGTTTLALVPASGQTANIIDIYNTSGSLSSVLTAGGFLGLGTTSPSQILSVQGNALLSGNLSLANITATGTLSIAGAITSTAIGANILPFASSTALSVSGTGYFGTASTTNLTISALGPSAGQCLTVNSSGVISTVSCSSGAAFAFTADTNYGGLTNSTSTPVWFKVGLQASSTSHFVNADFTNATTTTLGIGTLTGPLQAINGAVSATSTLSINYGGTGLSTLPTSGQLLVGNTAGGYTLTATSSLGLLASTSISASAPLSWNSSTGALSISQASLSTNGYLSSTDYTFFNNKISSTSLSAVYPLAYNSSTGVFTTAFSTTTTNSFNALNTFTAGLTSTGNTTLANATTSQLYSTNALSNTLAVGQSGTTTISATGALTTPSLSIASLTGPLQAINGAVSATSTLSVAYGGTGITTTPVYGQVLVGNNSGTYTLTATSSLGISLLSSLSSTYPVTYNSSTGVIGLAFSTTTANTWSALNVFNGNASTSQLSATKAYFGGTATSTFGSDGSLTLAQALGITSGGTGATSFSIGQPVYYNGSALVSSSTLGVNVGGTGSTTLTGILFGNGTGPVETLTVGSGLVLTGSTLSTNGVGVTGIGPLGQVQTGGTQLLATSTSGTDFTITASGNTQTFNLPFASPTASGKLSSTDYSAFTSKVSSTSLSGASVISYNSGTGVITTIPGTFGGASTYTFPADLLINGNATSTNFYATNASSTNASTTNLFAISAALRSVNLPTVTGSSILTTDANGTVVASSTPSAASYLAASPTATSTFAGGLSVASSLFVLQNGNIGVGIAAPTKTFEVNGTGKFSNTLTLSNVISCVGGQALQTDTSGNISCGSVTIGSAASGGGWTATGGSVNGNVSLATSTYVVAVGATSSPYAKLSVLSGSTSTTTLALLAASGQTANILDLYTANGALNTVITASGNLGLGTTSPSQILSVQGNGLLSGNLSVAGVTATGTVTIGSNLGLGTTSPDSKLSIVGGNIHHVASGNPTVATSSATSNHTYATYVSGRYAYTADYEGGLRIIDISNPKVPTTVGSYTGIATANAVVVSGKYAYVSDLNTGLNIIDVSNPNAPTLVGTYTLSFTSSVAVSGKYVFINDFNNSAVRIIDVSNPASPRLAGSYITAGGLGGPNVLTVQGKYLYIGDLFPALYIVDISNPTSPALMGSYTTAAHVAAPQGIYVSGKYAYVADATDGLTIFNVSNPKSPSYVGGYLSGVQHFYGVQVAGNYAYLADNVGSFAQVDISSPSAPTIIGTTTTNGLARNVFVSGKYAYVSAYAGGLAVMDINGIDSPAASIGSIETNTANISDALNVGGDIFAGGGLSVGISGILSRGTISAYVASSTQTNPVVANFMGGLVGIGTSSPYRTLSVTGSSDLGTNALAGYFTATSSTASVFPYASTTALTVSGTAYLGSLTGPLQAINGAVSATSTLSINYGGTGLSTLPTSGQLLVGNTAGGYTLTATSSLGLLASTSISASAPLSWNSSTGALSISQASLSTNGYLSSTDYTFFNDKISSTSLSAVYPLAYNSSTGVFTTAFSTTTTNSFNALNTFSVGLISLASTTIGDGTQAGGLTISGGATTTLNAYFGGSLNLGSSTPYAKLSINANVGENYGYLFGISSTTNGTATSTFFTISSTGALAASAASGVAGVNSGVTGGTGGTGSGANFTSGAGGVGGTGSTNGGTGGVSGSFVFSVGIGGNGANGSTNGGTGGGGNNGFSVTTGTGGTGGTGASGANNGGAGGTGGSIVVTNGTGGAGGSAGTQGGNGGNGANITLTAGNGGLGGSGSISPGSVGRGGSIILTPGTATGGTNGGVAIGTSTPNNLLDLFSTSKAAIGLSGASGSTYKWTFGMDVTNGGRFSIASSTALGTLDRFIIDGRGNVGIGTTSPYRTLSVAGSGIFTGGDVLASTLTATSSATIGSLSGFIGGNNGLLYAFATSSIKTSQLTNDSGFLTSLSGAASSTLLGDSNTFSGVNTFTQTIAGNISGSAGSVTSALTFNNSGSGDVSGSTYNGSAAKTISYNSLGAVPTTRNINTTFPLQGGSTLSGDLTLTSAFSTTTTTGLGSNLFVYTDNNGILKGVASSSLSLPNAALQNSSLTINGASVSLGGSITVSSTTLLANSNTFSGNNVFSGTNNFTTLPTLGTLTGPLQAINGAVSATSTLSINYGGTGLSTLPTSGQLLVGNTAGGYTLTATSSLGLLASTSISASAPLSWNSSTGALSISQASLSTNGYLSSTDYTFFNDKISSSSLSAVYPLAYNSSTGVFTTAFSTTTTNSFNALNTFSVGLISLASTTIGDGTQAGGLTISGGATTTGNLLVQGGTTLSAATSTSLAVTGSTTISGIFNAVGGANFGTIAATGAITSTATGANTLPFASSTALTVSGTGYFGTASTTNLTISALGPSAGQCLTVNSSGSVSATACGAGSSFPFTQTTFGSTNANATSTLIGFTQGLYALASSTIGDGTQAGGLTISGGATTTLNAYFGGNVGVGTTSPAALFAVSGSGYFAGNLNLDQYSTYKLAGQTVLSATSTTQNTLVGLLAGSNILSTSTSLTSGLRNTALGYQSLFNATSTDDNVAIGYQALFGTSTAAFSGGSNVAVGNWALASTTSGTGNTGVGYQAMLKNENGSFNAAFGEMALAVASSTQPSSQNTALGAFAMSGFFAFNNGGYAHNTAVGESALWQVTPDAYGNTALGSIALGNAGSSTKSVGVGLGAGGGSGVLYKNTGSVSVGAYAGNSFTNSSDYNTLLGYQSGYLNTSGYGNIMIGAQMNTSGTGYVTTGGNNIGLGFNTLFPSATANNQLNIGNFLFGTLPATTSNNAFTLPTSGAFGVGTSSPFAKFSIHTNNGDTETMLFAIGSSTASATTTLFKVDNTGLTTLLNLSATNATTTTLGIGTLTGPLQAINGAVSATSTLSINYGGTGLSTLPSSGQLLVGNTAGGYTLTATSSLGLLASTSISASAPLSWNSSTGALSISQASLSTNGYLSSTDYTFFNDKISSTSLSATYPLAYNSSTGVFTTAFSTTTTNSFNALNTFSAGLISLASTTIGDGTQAGGLTVSGGATTTGNLLVQGGATLSAATSTSLAVTGSTTISGIFNAVGGANFGTIAATGAITSTATGVNTLPFASSTAFTVSGTGYFGTASTTNLTISALGPSAGQCLTVNSSGSVSATACGAGSSFPFTQTTFGSTNANATSTLIGFTNGLYALASSTIGDGSQTGGLTISGGATTTGNAYFGGNVGVGTTSPAALFAVNGNGYFAGNLNLDQYSTYKLAGQTVLSATSTTQNTLVGLLAGSNILSTSTSLTSGLRNTALGYQSLFNATSTDDNVAIGYQALFGTSTAAFSGGSNVAVGNWALASTTDGSNNTAVGYQALFAINGSGNSAFGYQALGISTSTVVSTSNTAIGVGSLSGASYVFGETVGGFANNTALGVSALGAGTVAAYGDTAIGMGALFYGASTTQSVAVGHDAALGSAPYKNKGSVAVGANAGIFFTNSSDYNTLLGYQSGYLNTSGYGNIMIGAQMNTSGTGYVSTGGNNIGLGFNTLFPSATASNQLNIGNFLFGTLPATTSNSAFTLPTSGAFGVGTSSPFAKFSIHTNNGDTETMLFAIGSSTASATTTLFSISNTGLTTLLNLSATSATTSALAVTGSTTISGAFNAVGGALFGAATTTGNAYFGGNVGVGTTSPAALFAVNGSGYFAGNLNLDQYSSYKLAGQTVLSATSTTQNTLVGLLAGSNILSTSTSLTSGLRNTALGYQSLFNATSTDDNIAIGYQALFSTSTGAFSGGSNVAVGNWALASTTSGTGNTAVGHQALSKNEGGGFNAAFGDLALAVASSTQPSGENTALGAFAMSGFVVFTNGGYTHNTAVGESALWQVTPDAYGNTALGSLALGGAASSTKSVGVGLGAGGGIIPIYKNTGSVSVGAYAGGSFTNSSDYNTLLGYQSGYLNTSGYGNIMIGAQMNTSGTGYVSTGGNNIGLGFNTLFPSATASNQLNIGNFLFGTLPATTSNSAFTLPTSGAFGVGTSSPFAKFSIHTNDGDTATTLFAIGSSTASATTTLFSIDNTGVTTIGDSAGVGDASFQFASDSNAWSMGYNSTDKSFNIASSTSFSANVVFTITKDTVNRVGIASTTPWRTFDVNGSVGFKGLTTGAGAGALCLSSNNEVVYNAGSSACSVSSARFKTNIATSSVGLAEIMQLRPVSFRYKNGVGDNGAQEYLGLIAEEVAAVDSRLVLFDASSSPYAVKYENIDSVLVKAVQDVNLNLETVASTTASSTPASQSFAQSFFTAMFARMTNWLADAGNGIANIFAQTITATTVNADTVNAKTLCLEGLCVTKTQLQALLSGQGASAVPSGGSGSAVSTTSATDTIPPVVSIIGNNPATLNVGDSYVDLGATVTDNVDVNLGYKTFVDNVLVSQVSIDTSTSTTHYIDYVATDSAGNTATSTRQVNVVDPNATATPAP